MDGCFRMEKKKFTKVTTPEHHAGQFFIPTPEGLELEKEVVDLQVHFIP